jgi:RimJ/RimL family protein N-acetyltransferase
MMNFNDNPNEKDSLILQQKSIFSKQKKVLWLAAAFFSILAVFGFSTYYFIYKSQKSYWGKVSKQPDIIKGKIITLKTIQEEHFIDMHNMLSNAVRKGLSFPEYFTLNYTINYLRHKMNRVKQGKAVNYCIFDNQDNRAVGFVEIRDKNNDDPGQLATWLNENYWGGGRMQEALKLISEIYFSMRNNVDKFDAYVEIWNKRSYRALKKFGMQDAGFIQLEGKSNKHYVLECHRKK